MFNQTLAELLPIPRVKKKAAADETGCGDQVTAIVAGGLAEGKDLLETSRLAVKAGTLQFYKEGIQPLSKKEILEETGFYKEKCSATSNAE